MRNFDIDLLVLAESFIPLPDLLAELNQGDRTYFADVGDSIKLTIVSRFEPSRTVKYEDRGSYSIRGYSPYIGEPFNVVAVHMPSKGRQSTEDQIFAFEALRDSIQDLEVTAKHSRTVLVGDFNVNPFEFGMVGTGGLHAVMDRRVARTMSRVVQDKSFKFFYNPMWSVLGDRDESPPGTYFYNKGTAVNYYWHTFDQVLIRPDLLDFFFDDGLTVVRELSGRSLLCSLGRPDHDVSDHLPIVFKFNDIELINEQQLVG